jgi:hypothetical protein
MAYNFQIGNNKIKLLTKYESVTKKVLFGRPINRRIDTWEEV